MVVANIVNTQKETETKKWNMKRCKFTQTRLVVANMRNTNLLCVNMKDLSESFCLIVTKFFFTTMSLSSLIWYVFMFLSLRSVANWRWAMMLTVFMVAGCGRGARRSRLSRSTAYHYFFLCLHSQSRRRPAPPLPSRVGRRSLIIRLGRCPPRWAAMSASFRGDGWILWEIARPETPTGLSPVTDHYWQCYSFISI